ncbi:MULTISPECIES: site-specific integrase [unclassified Serratia (in: enterobacteria)]|uniref:tyrosine-type recombinase/integrase n=1 Tax=unclassified Serratia (in: enterobacteria) TaxID=2647522 RepID=UPI0005067D58|nr:MULTISPECIES: site-specific integrase [unclassified Serratia (in: enterobacteria)]KFK92929.1 integrase [Serratia sp. Ag2]KFL00028.1 integrase [Serratia sp. Ag1]
MSNAPALIPLPRPAAKTCAYDAYIQSLSVAGRKGIISLLKRSAAILGKQDEASTYPWETLCYADVMRVRARLLDEGYAVSSVNMALSALRSIAQTAFNLQQMDAETLARIKAVKRVQGDPVRKGRALSRTEIRSLLKAAKSHGSPTRQCRDAAILLTLCGTGLRAGELVALKMDDYIKEEGKVIVRQGKGRKYREIYVAPAVAKALSAWLVAKGEGKALFTKVSRSGQAAAGALTTAGLTAILEQLKTGANVAEFTPHDLRRTFITQLLDQGIDINTVRQLAGHSDITTTARYDHRGDTAKIMASRTLKCW